MTTHADIGVIASPEPSSRATARVTQDPVMVLRAIAALLTPCLPPDTAAGWDRCAHAERWPCPTTRAYWLAANIAPSSGS